MSPKRLDLDYGLTIRVIAAWLLFMWPVVIFGGPAYFSDSTSYFKGGAVAMSVMARQFAHAAPTSAPSSGSAADRVVSTVGGNIKGARSATYSVVTYLLSGPDSRLIFLVVMQALVLAICVVSALAFLGIDHGGLFWGTLLVLTAATPAAWFAGYAMPDIFAGTTILTLAILASPKVRRPLGMPLRMVLIAIAAFGISAHVSHIAVAAIMIPFLLICLRLERPSGSRLNLSAFGWVGGTVAVSVLMVVGSAVLGFGEYSLAPKRYPLSLGRSIEQGPARWYLEGACPTRHYQVCELYPRGIPRTAFDFLWGPQSVSLLATPAQMDRLREEERDILLAATWSYPVATLRAVAGGLLAQLADFGPGDLNFDRAVKRVSPINIVLVPRPKLFAWLAPITLDLTWVTVLASLAACALYLRRTNVNFQWGCIILFGVVVNASVCATFSAVAARYQGRVIWLLPLVAVALWVGSERRAKNGAEHR